MSDIPENHPRYRSLKTRERLATAAGTGIVSLEGLTSHGRGEAFDYLIGETTPAGALEAEKLAAKMLLAAHHPVLSVNGNTAVLAASEIAELQSVSGAEVEVNLFHRTEERMARVTAYLEEHGVVVSKGPVERCIPLPHGRGLCRPCGIGSADVVLVPLEDGDRCGALVSMGKRVITIDLNPLDRTSGMATLPIIDEVTRALPNISAECRRLQQSGEPAVMPEPDSRYFLLTAVQEIIVRLQHALD
jgi:4-phosphopantoate--beta-alanine ligase